MEVWHWQQVLAALLEPLGTLLAAALWAAAIATRVESQDRVFAVIALLYVMQAKLWRPACDKVSEDPFLCVRQPQPRHITAGVRELPDDVRHFQRWRRHLRLSARVFEQIEGAFSCRDPLPRDVVVNVSRAEASVAEHSLYQPYVVAGLQ